MNLRKFDIFPKLDNEFRIGTTLGGILTLSSLLAALFLAYHEFYAFFHPPIRQALTIDSTRPTKEDGRTISSESQSHIEIFFNITFPHAPCFLMHFDVIDPVSQMVMPNEPGKTKFFRLKKGERVSKLNPDIFDDGKEFPDDCLSLNTVGCTSCKKLYQAFRDAAATPVSFDQAPQCKHLSEEFQTHLGEGCEISSFFRVPKMGAEFHVSPGISWSGQGMHIHYINLFGFPVDQTNLTHTINRLQFTQTDEDMPLDGFTNVQNKSTMWRVTYAADVLGHGFTASKFALKDPQSKTPGIIFKYDVSPITAVSYPDREPLLHLVTRLFTVIGAVLGGFRVIDSLCYNVIGAKKGQTIQ